jgi:hypothetical protein
MMVTTAVPENAVEDEDTDLATMAAEFENAE